MRRASLLVVLAACEGGRPAPAISAAPPEVAHADARLALPIPSDGAVGSGELDAAVRARLPKTPISIAVPVKLSGITIATLDQTGLHVSVDDDDVGNESIAWVDDHELVTLDSHFENGWTVTSFVDGVRDMQVTIAKAEWDQVSSTLLVTRANEVYINQCTKWGENYGPCLRTNYARMLPTRGPVTTKRPPGVIEHRNVEPYIGNELWPLPTTVKPPSDIAVTIEQDSHKYPIKSHVLCTASGESVEYPNDEWDGSYGFTAEKLRWVMVTPPIYELTAIVVDPVLQHEHVHEYFRGCAKLPVKNFAWLADGLWAEYDELAEPSGWTIYADATPIGTIPGLGALRATGPRK